MGKIDHVQVQIGKILKQDTRGLTIQEIADATHVSRITASLALAKLEGAGKITIRPIGNCKLHYLKQKGGRSS